MRGDAPGATGPGEPTPTITLSTAECRDRVAEHEGELEAVRAEMDRLDDEVALLRRRRDRLERVAQLFEPPPADVVSAAKAVGRAAREAVVYLEFGGGSATGWYVDERHVITNAHNVIDSLTGEHREATVWTIGGDSSASTVVDAVGSTEPDVALLRTADPAPASLSPGSTPEDGSDDPLVQVGHPGGVGNWVITLGFLRSVFPYETPDGRSITELLTRVPGLPGVSGSPLLDLDGDVVGLTYAGTDVFQRQADEPPIVAEPTVYDRPIAPLAYGAHVSIDDVMDLYGRWT